MALRAPDPKDKPTYENAQHILEGHWEPGKLWRAMKGDDLMAETSTPNTDIVFQDALNHGATSYQQRRFVLADEHWIEQEPPTRTMPEQQYHDLPKKNPDTIYYIKPENP